MTNSEEDLIQLAVAGNDDALGTLLQQAAPRLRNHLEPRLPRRHQAVISVEDILQVTFLEAHLDARHLKGDNADSFFGWLVRIANNNLLDAVRELEAKKRPNPANRIEAAQSTRTAVDFIQELCGKDSTPSRQAARAEQVDVIGAALGQLPPDYEQVVRLYDLQCKPVAEVATMLGRTEGAVFMLRARAHERLKILLGSGSRFFSNH